MRGGKRAHRAGMPCIAVVFDTAAAECRRRNAARPVPVPADVVANQMRRWPTIREAVRAEPWDDVHDTRSGGRGARRAGSATPHPGPSSAKTATPATTANACQRRAAPVELRLAGRARAARVSICGPSLPRRRRSESTTSWMMDHLRQIPQVGAAMGRPARAVHGAGLAGCRHRAGPARRARVARLSASPGRARQTDRHPRRAVCRSGDVRAGRRLVRQGVQAAPASSSRRSIDATAHLDDALQALPVLWGKGSPRFEGATVDDRRSAVLSPTHPGAPADRRRWIRRTTHAATGCPSRRRVQPVRRARDRGRARSLPWRATARRSAAKSAGGRPDRGVTSVDGVDRSRP